MRTAPAVLDALGDSTRRKIVERLHELGPLPVGAIARGLPVSRPAVSKHLRVLEAAALVRFTSEGTRNVYRLEPAGFATLRSWVEDFWSGALLRFKEVAES